MTAYPLRRTPLMLGLLLLGAAGAALAAPPPPAPVPLGDHTYRLTHTARWTFSYNTDKLERLAREDAARFCASLGKRMKEVSMSAQKASVFYGGVSSATIVFKALDLSDPELAAAPGAAPPPSDRQMLDALHDKHLLSDPEYDAARERMAEQSPEMAQLVELHRKGILSDTEFEAAKARLHEQAK